ncbi:MAG TPA: DNA methyltransferase [Patescibacteria group bacterium]|nr:DNA methyltransferase [Patescibacteria group bacterium]
MSDEKLKNGMLFKAKNIKLIKQKKLTNPKNDEKPPFETTTLWDYPKQSYGAIPKGNNKFQGVTPAFIIWNMIQRYTQPGDLVVDPMCGSGTTIDVCNEEGRKVIGYDIHPQREDIIKNDARKIPLKDNSADMVFIDSPYGDNVNYGTDPLDIGKISAEDSKFYQELEKTTKEIYRVLKPGKVVGWLIGDQWVKRKFTPVGFKIYAMMDKYFEPVDLICVTRRQQSSNTGVWHYRARKFNFFLRGFKHLIIMRKPLEKATPEKSKPNKTKVKWKKYK